MTYRTRRSLGTGVWVLSTILLLLVVFFPIYWMVAASVREGRELFAFPPSFFPQVFTAAGYRAVLGDPSFLTVIFNTVIVTTGTTIAALCVAMFGAYGMSRYRFRGRRFLHYYILVTQMIPVVLMTMPFFAFYSWAGLYDTRLGLITAYLSFTLPFCVLTMYGFISTIPASLDEAAEIDGCTAYQTFFRIIVPLSKAGMVATGVFAFITAWNEFLMAVVLTRSVRARMIVVLIGMRIGQYNIAWNELMAITVAASLPLVVMYMFVQKAFVSGMTAGAVKF